MNKKALVGLCVLSWLVTLASLGYLGWQKWGSKQVVLEHGKASLYNVEQLSLTYLGINQVTPSDEKKDTKLAVIEIQGVDTLGVLMEDPNGFKFGTESSDVTFNLKPGQHVRFGNVDGWYKLVLIKVEESQAVVVIRRIMHPQMRALQSFTKSVIYNCP